MDDAELARRVRRSTLATRTLVVAIVVFLVLGTTALVTLAVLNRESLSLIKSCTTTGQPCNNQGKKQTGDAVANINRVVILAAACSIGVSPDLPVSERKARITSCVIDQLARP